MVLVDLPLPVLFGLRINYWQVGDGQAIGAKPQFVQRQGKEDYDWVKFVSPELDTSFV